MDQSSWDDTLVGLRPPGANPGDTVSLQSSRDERAKCSPGPHPGKEGKAISDSDDLELQALQRELDDAFETTRPRPAFEDELWSRMQAQRPAPARLRDAWSGFIEAIRQAPAVPMAAVAALLVVVLGVGFIVNSGVGRNGSSSASLATEPQSGAAQANQLAAPGAFGRLPSPAFNPNRVGPTALPPTVGALPAASGATEYPGTVTLTWTGTINVTIPTAPVFRYSEPSTNVADQFAAALGATLQSRPAGFLGSYETIDLNVQVRGSVQSPPHEPVFIIRPITPLPPGDAAGGPGAVGLVFLAEHSLAPSWPYTVDVSGTADQPVVNYLRQFTVPGYGLAYLVDDTGAPYGMEVDLASNRVTLATGPLGLAMDQADYPLVSADQAIQAALATSAPAGTAGAPSVKLSTAELVYALAVAGDHSFYEPEFLFSGTLVVNGTTYVKHVVVPAVDPSQRS